MRQTAASRGFFEKRTQRSATSVSDCWKRSAIRLEIAVWITAMSLTMRLITSPLAWRAWKLLDCARTRRKRSFRRAFVPRSPNSWKA
ncbi:MAG: hypothetical protein BWX64_02832 [Acidobacteria bacterium ADurb.Bin051]|nr:MAG: hypothetical protein BWX64_02832 [Acidobacteria bacterium ADurb.Bin051]